MVICFALSTAMATCVWCCNEIEEANETTHDFAKKKKKKKERADPHLRREEREDLPDDGVQPLPDLRLLVHLHVETVGHLVVLRGEMQGE